MNLFAVTRWPPDAGQVTINKVRARLEQEGLKPYRFEMVPGDEYGDHSHPEDEIRWVVSGRMRIRVREGARRGTRCSWLQRVAPPGACGCDSYEEIILGPGDRLDLAAGVVHAADVVGDEVVVMLCASHA
jgi:quercetin dioxygenase-like cupin family protein